MSEIKGAFPKGQVYVCPACGRPYGSNSASLEGSSSFVSKEVDRKIAEASTNLAKRLLRENVFNANISEFIELLNLLEEAGYIKD